MFYSKKLKRFKNIKHCFFSRKGGFSKGLYKSLNCGRGSKDKKKKILKNLNFVSTPFLSLCPLSNSIREIQHQQNPLHWLHQAHLAHVFKK